MGIVYTFDTIPHTKPVGSHYHAIVNQYKKTVKATKVYTCTLAKISFIRSTYFILSEGLFALLKHDFKLELLM